ncbi:amino acid ABC transporter permease [Uliginosibacterium sp. 31-12]|nr:amino acid ABC transporter permease [Uliginosibacterium sp. 31-12]MDO6388113.1 amino acid ABC transporter permease [Uliginosibacterium sp. 31-12]
MMMEFTLWDILRNLGFGALWTIGLSLTAFVLGGTAGLLVLAARMAKSPWLQRGARVYIEFFQGTPLLMQLFMVFFGIALLGVDVPPWLAAALGLTLFSSAYLAEIWRGCVEAIPKGQWEASASLAMTWLEQMRHVILPQALRVAVAPTVGFSVQIVKGTAVTSIIGFAELTKTGSMLANATFQPFMVFGFVALGYFILCYPLSHYAASLERKFHGSTSGSH